MGLSRCICCQTNDYKLFIPTNTGAYIETVSPVRHGTTRARLQQFAQQMTELEPRGEPRGPASPAPAVNVGMQARGPLRVASPALNADMESRGDSEVEVVGTNPPPNEEQDDELVSVPRDVEEQSDQEEESSVSEESEEEAGSVHAEEGEEEQEEEEEEENVNEREALMLRTDERRRRLQRETQEYRTSLQEQVQRDSSGIPDEIEVRARSPILSPLVEPVVPRPVLAATAWRQVVFEAPVAATTAGRGRVSVPRPSARSSGSVAGHSVAGSSRVSSVGSVNALSPDARNAGFIMNFMQMQGTYPERFAQLAPRDREGTRLALEALNQGVGEGNRLVAAMHANAITVTRFLHPRNLDLPDRSEPHIFKYGSMTFAAETERMAEELAQQLRRLFVEPGDSGNCVCGSCHCAFGSRVELLMHVEQRCGDFPPDPSNWFSPYFPVAFLVRNKIITLLSSTATPDNGPLDMLDPDGIPYSVGPSAKHRFRADKELNQETQHLKSTRRDEKNLWSMWVNKERYLVRNERGRYESIKVPVVLNLSFLRPMEDWPRDAIALHRRQTAIAAGQLDG
jgi:hypothetical protein